MNRKAHVIFYTRPGCHLCDEARRAIAAARTDVDYTLEEVNIELDPELKRRYGWDIPVVSINGTVAFKHRLTPAEFARELSHLA